MGIYFSKNIFSLVICILKQIFFNEIGQKTSVEKIRSLEDSIGKKVKFKDLNEFQLNLEGVIWILASSFFNDMIILIDGVNRIFYINFKSQLNYDFFYLNFLKEY